MKIIIAAATALALALTLGGGAAQAETSKEQANKALVLKFWRECFDAHDSSKGLEYMTPEYIQHNPNVASGRQAFVDYFGKLWGKPLAPADIKVTKFDEVLADGDLVQLVAMRPKPEPGDPTKTYPSFWFDLFRVTNGKISEHWDGALKPTK